jgi:hypothetical protein
MYNAIEQLKKDLKEVYPNLVNFIDEFKQSAIDFQVKTGLIGDVKNLESLENALSVQTEQVREEMNEFKDAIQLKDKTEAVDGIVDVIFTMVNFDFITQQITNITNDSSLCTAMLDLMPIGYELKVKRYLPDFFKMNIEEKDIINSAKLISINNSQKYTDNLYEAVNWDIDLSDGLATHIVATPVDDDVYFCLKDNKGKVRKHKNFKKVDLNFLIKNEGNDE